MPASGGEGAVAVRTEMLPVASLARLGVEWRALEMEVADLSFFQSWSWVGCLADERYGRPVLVKVSDAGRTVGLALFNKHRGRLCLAESGDAALDAPFIEHNAPLCVGGAPVLAAILRTAAAAADGLTLNGVPAAILAAAPGVAFRCQRRIAPCIDLAALAGTGGDHLATLSANTRQQIRRSGRHFAAQGAMRLERAATLDAARDMLAEMIALHGASWRARGQPGAFAHPFVRRFHEALLAEAMPRGEIDLLRLSAGATTVGILYNFRLGGRVSAYQSGFMPGGGHARPGLSCHAAAIAQALAQGERVYDFLAGADRYKLSLARDSVPLFWAETVPRWSWRGMAARLRDHVASLRGSSRASSASGGGGGPA